MFSKFVRMSNWHEVKMPFFHETFLWYLQLNKCDKCQLNWFHHGFANDNRSCNRRSYVDCKYWKGRKFSENQEPERMAGLPDFSIVGSKTAFGAAWKKRFDLVFCVNTPRLTTRRLASFCQTNLLRRSGLLYSSNIFFPVNLRAKSINGMSSNDLLKRQIQNDKKSNYRLPHEKWPEP